MVEFGNQLLRWMSERGSGKWTELSSVISYLRTARRAEFRQRGLEPAAFRPSDIAADIAALGHIDIDWRSGTWSVSRPTFNVIPGLGLCVVLTGSRTAKLEQRLEEATDSLDIYPFDKEQFPLPSAKFLKCADIETVKKAAEKFGADVIFNPSLTLTEHMCPLNELPIERVGEPRLEDARKYTPGQTHDWSYVSSFDDGLFRVDHTGRVLFRRRVSFNGEVHWHAVDRATGQLLESSRLGIRVAQFQVSPREKVGFMSVAKGISLPIGVERALTLCTGTTAERHNGVRYFRNVPENLAREILRITLQN